MSTLQDIETALTETEERHREAKERWERMHISDPNFIALGNTIPKLERQIATLRQKQAAAEYCVDEPEVASETVDQRCEEWIMTLAKAVDDALDELRDRVSEIEARPQMNFRGVWQVGEGYEIGDVCSFGGSMWVAKQTNRAVKNLTQPGGNDCWQLVVKRGRDGKDASR